MIKIKRSKDGQFYAVVIGANGKVLQQSETVKTKASALKNLAATAKVWDKINKTVGVVGTIE